MSVMLIADCYSSICNNYAYGKNFLELPENILIAIDEYFDGKTIDLGGRYNPDNVYVNDYLVLSYREAIVYYARLLTHEEYSQLEDTGQVAVYVEEHFDEIEERISDSCYLLGFAKGYWHVFS